jgi:hypothetical protein
MEDGAVREDESTAQEQGIEPIVLEQRDKRGNDLRSEAREGNDDDHMTSVCMTFRQSPL